MISHVLPLLVAAAGIGANARALPVAQGVTELLTPGASPGQCTVTAARTFGVSIAPAGGAAPLKKRQDVTQIADGQLQAMGNAGFVGNNAIDIQAANAAGTFAQGVITPEIGNIAAANVAVPQAIAAASAGFGLGPATQIYDGQVQAPASVAQAQAQALTGFGSASVTQIYDGQIQAPGYINQIQDVTPINQIYDGQLQAANQIYGGQAQVFASQPIAPINQFETFAPINQIYDGQLQTVNQIYDGQLQAPGFINQIQDVTPLNQIYDGQLQAVNQIYDGQVQAPGFINQIQDVTPINQIYDGQLQVANQIYGGQAQAQAQAFVSQPIAPLDQLETLAPLNQIYDGQIQAFSQVPEQFGASVLNVAPAALDFGTVTQIYDGQIQAPATVAQAQAQAFGPIPQAYNSQVQAFGLAPEVLSVHEVAYTPEDVLYTTNQVTQIMDGQIQAPAGIVEQMNFPAQVNPEFIGVPQSPSALVPQSPVVPMTQITDGQVQVVAKRQNGVPVALSLNNGILYDSQGRTGYIADNRQLQFDAPPQGGAIFTGGFSACNDGTLALGDSNTFYACGSSDFNNIYDQPIYPNNCSPINLVVS